MKTTFKKLKSFLAESDEVRNLILESGQNTNTIGAAITESFPCIYWYFNVDKGLTIEDVLPPPPSSSNIDTVNDTDTVDTADADIAADDTIANTADIITTETAAYTTSTQLKPKKPGIVKNMKKNKAQTKKASNKNPPQDDEQDVFPTVPEGFLNIPRANVENPLKFKNNKIKNVDGLHMYLNDSMQTLFSKSKNNRALLDEKLKEASNIYEALKKHCARKTVKGVYWTADKANKTEELIDIHSEADICVKYTVGPGVEESWSAISIKADANAFNKSNTLKGCNRTLTTWFLPAGKDGLSEHIEPIRTAVNTKLNDFGFDPVQPIGFELRGENGLKAISNNYNKIRTLIINNGVGTTIDTLSTMRDAIETEFISKFVEITNGLDQKLFKKIIKNSLGYADGLLVWKADGNVCKDITDEVKLVATEINGGSHFEAAFIESKKSPGENPSNSTTPNVTFTWSSGEKNYKLDVQIRLSESFTKARKEENGGANTPSIPVLNKTLDNFVKADIESLKADSKTNKALAGAYNRMAIAYRRKFFQSVIFAIFFKPVESWKIMSCLPGNHSIVSESRYRSSSFSQITDPFFPKMKKSTHEREFYKNCIRSLVEFLLENDFTCRPIPPVHLHRIAQDEQNPFKQFTGYFRPDSFEIHLFLHGRHPKDVLRTLAHELVHVKQFNEDRLAQGGANLEDDPELRECELEAFTQGNLGFRMWTEQMDEKEAFEADSPIIGESEDEPDVSSLSRLLMKNRGVIRAGLKFLERFSELNLVDALNEVGFTLDIVPDDEWTEGKVEPTEASEEDRTIRVRRSYYESNPGFCEFHDRYGWSFHEMVHAVIFSGNMPDDFMQIDSPFRYPMNTDEIYAFGFQLMQIYGSKTYDRLMTHYANKPGAEEFPEIFETFAKEIF